MMVVTPDVIGLSWILDSISRLTSLAMSVAEQIGPPQEVLRWLSSKSFKLQTFTLVTLLKLLLLPSYFSTDFEVHRNWLAITGSLPIKQWYVDSRSEWTLDYPPFFAYFEWLLAQVARHIDVEMLQVDNHNYASAATIGFQRGSVMVCDLVLASGAWYAVRRLNRCQGNIVFFLIVANPGLLLVDHMHFQYNGLLLGVLLWSLGFIIEGKDLFGGLLFAVLVNMKQLYAVLGPAYFVYLLRNYCRGEKAVYRFAVLGLGVSSVFALSLGPFVEMGQIQQVLARLFPFQRGLCHAYWAANAWALYAALDKAMVAVLKFVDLPVDSGMASLTGGLVGPTKFAVMPDIPPAVPLVMVVIAIMPVLYTLWKNPNAIVFVKAITYCSLSSFMLGYHVHEKAVLGVTVTSALTALASRRSAGEYLFLVIVSTYALFPLLQGLAEYPVKVLLLLAYVVIASQLLRKGVQPPPEVPSAGEQESSEAVKSKIKKGLVQEHDTAAMLDPLEIAYLAGLIPVELYASIIHSSFFQGELPFLPLMLISVYCAVGMVWVWSQPGVIEISTSSAPSQRAERSDANMK